MTLAPLKVRPAPPGGIRRGDRPGRAWVEMNGANPMLDQNLLRVLYTLSEITGEPRYAKVADEELAWFFNNTMSPKTSLLPWGEHLSWDVILDVPISGGDEMMHEFARPWVLWDRCFALVPEASRKFALGLVGTSDRQPRNRRLRPSRAVFRTRSGRWQGFPAPRARFTSAHGVTRWKHTKDEAFPARHRDNARALRTQTRAERRLDAPPRSARLECELAATMVPDPLASRLRKFAAEGGRIDPRGLRETSSRRRHGRQRRRKWQTGYSAGTLAHPAMFCLARHEQTNEAAYRELLVVKIADQYLNSHPEEDVDAWPMSFAPRDQHAGRRSSLHEKARLSRAGAHLRAAWPSTFSGRTTRCRARASIPGITKRSPAAIRSRSRCSKFTPRRTTCRNPNSVEHDRPMKCLRPGIVSIALAMPYFGLEAAEIPKAPVPPSPFLKVVYAYADAMLANGRDVHGPQKTGLLLSALDRKTGGLLTDAPMAPANVPAGARVVSSSVRAGANPQHDENLLRLLYTLSELSAKPVYREAADAELRWMAGQAAPADAETIWDVQTGWDVVEDRAIRMDSGWRSHRRPWMLWDRAFDVAADAAAMSAWRECAQRSDGRLIMRGEVPDAASERAAHGLPHSDRLRRFFTNERHSLSEHAWRAARGTGKG